MNKESIWTNKDGLYVGFGTREVDNTNATKHKQYGNLQSVVLKIVGTELVAAASIGGKQLANAPIIPAGSEIYRVRLVVDTQFAGANALLDVGAFGASDDAVDDADGFLDAITVATLVTGFSADYVTTGGGGFDGDLIKTILAVDTKVVPALGDANAFTAGVATVTVEYSTPAN